MIKHLENTDINFVRWDNCINNAINGNIFAYSWYLNILCEEWEALVLGNYEYVMPLFHKTKFNKKIYFSSKLGIRLGVYSNKLITHDIVQKFIDAIPSDKSLINLSLNIYNHLNSPNVRMVSTYELDLIQSHQKIAEKYSNQFQKDLETAHLNKITITQGLLPNELINFALSKKVYSKPKLKENQISQLRMIIANSLRYHLGETYCAYGDHNNLQAAAFFVKSKKKIHLLFAAISQYGIHKNAFHLLIDKYIEVHSEKDLTLNIENSIAKNNKEFFTGVGAHEVKYQQYYKNNLPRVYKLILNNN